MMGGGTAVPLTVAILTRSEDRVQPLRLCSWWWACVMLRSSPGPKTGCSPVANGSNVRPAGLRSSPGPKTGCSAARPGRLVQLAGVAILTRSEDRVQHPHRPRTGRWGGVAILTRSEDRVQPRVVGRTDQRALGCDPHPVRRPGAAGDPPGRPGPARRRCDPHPVRRPGAAIVINRTA